MFNITIEGLKWIWEQLRRLGWFGVALAVATGAFFIWDSLPDAIKLRVIEWAAPPEARPAAIDVAVSEFAIETPDDPDLLWLRNKIERNLVELLTGNGKRVAHPLAIVAEDAGRHARISGSLGRNAPGTVEIAIRLDDENGGAVSSASFEAPAQTLRENYKSLPETLLFGLDVSPRSLKPLRPRNANPGAGGTRTLSAQKSIPLAAMLLYFEARRKAGQGAIPEAMAKLEQAIASEPRFAMAHWAMGELLKAKGDGAGAAGRQKKAREIDPDHPRLPIGPNVAQPLANLLPALKGAPWRPVAEGAESRRMTSEAYGIEIDAWRFDQERFGMGVVLQKSLQGSSAKDLRKTSGAALVVNGGFFEIDSERRLAPTGFVVSGGGRAGGYQPAGGSALLYSSGGRIGIDWSRNWETLGALDEAVQAGPMVVDPGGKNGVKANDFNRANRTAVCLSGSRVIAVVATGGLSLFELGEILAASERDGGFECERAINLDGGPSAQAAFELGAAKQNVKGTWRVQNAVTFRAR